MAIAKRFFKTPRLTAPQQRARMLLEWPALESRVEGRVLHVTGVVQPSPITGRYAIQVVYRELAVPRASVLRPTLSRRSEAPDIPIPHTFGFNTPGAERPCLFYPDGREWNPGMPIAVTVMPWLLAWLMDYEIWVATGEWLGGGMPHRDDKRDLNNEAA